MLAPTWLNPHNHKVKMKFFNVKPADKITSIAKHLETQLQIRCNQKWSLLFDRLQTNNALFNQNNLKCEELDQFLGSVLSHPNRSEKNFIFPLPNNFVTAFIQDNVIILDKKGVVTNSKFSYFNIVKQLEHDRILLSMAKEITSQLNASKPDYSYINILADKIRNKETIIPSPDYGVDNSFKMSYVSGSGIFFDLFIEPYWVLFYTITMLVSLVATPSVSHYGFGTFIYENKSSFRTDLLSELTESICRFIRAVIFPLAIIYSKINTDSINVFKGELARATDSLIELTDQLQHQTADLKPANDASISLAM